MDQILYHRMIKKMTVKKEKVIPPFRNRVEAFDMIHRVVVWELLKVYEASRKILGDL